MTQEKWVLIHGSRGDDDPITAPQRVHECSICGRRGFWDSNWSWYGSERDLDDGTYKTFCSPECVMKHHEQGAG